MTRLENIPKNALASPDGVALVKSVQSFADQAHQVVFNDRWTCDREASVAPCFVVAVFRRAATQAGVP